MIRHASVQDLLDHMARAARNERIDHVLFNGELTDLGCPERLAAFILQKGWDVVNAPRPLACAYQLPPEAGQPNAEWQGPFLHGVFYAAGPAEEKRGSGTLGELWTSDHAFPILLVTNTTILQALRAYATANGIDGLDRQDLEELAPHYLLPLRSVHEDLHVHG